MIFIAKSRKEGKGSTRSEPLFSIDLEKIKNIFFNKIVLISAGIILVLAAIVILALKTPILSSIIDWIKNISLSRNTLVYVGVGIGLLALITTVIFIIRSVRKTTPALSYAKGGGAFDRLRMIFFNKTFLIISAIAIVLAAVVVLALTTSIFSSFIIQLKNLLQGIGVGKNIPLLIGIAAGLVIIIILVVLILKSGNKMSPSSNIHQRWYGRY